MKILFSTKKAHDFLVNKRKMTGEIPPFNGKCLNYYSFFYSTSLKLLYLTLLSKLEIILIDGSID